MKIYCVLFLLLSCSIMMGQTNDHKLVQENFSFYLEKAESGDANAQHKMGNYYKAENNIDKAVFWILRMHCIGMRKLQNTIFR